MASVKELLELRKQIKNKNPDFIRQDAHKKKRLGSKWRRPKGLHSKIRLNLRGRARKVSIGYRTPKKVRNLHKSGMKQNIIKSENDLDSLDSKKDGIIISSSFGNRKRITILKKAKEAGFNIINFKNPEEFIKKVEDGINLKKKIEKEKKKDAKMDEKGKKLGEKVAEVSKKDADKKEKDKILTKKDK